MVLQFAVTETEAQQYMDIGVSQDKIDIVPNWISLSEYEELPLKGEFRKQYGMGNDDTIVLYLGRINKIKGIELNWVGGMGIVRQTAYSPKRVSLFSKFTVRLEVFSPHHIK